MFYASRLIQRRRSRLSAMLMSNCKMSPATVDEHYVSKRSAAR